jgi:hypothetical protein
MTAIVRKCCSLNDGNCQEVLFTKLTLLKSKFLGLCKEPRFFKKLQMRAADSSCQDASLYLRGYLVGFNVVAPRIVTVPTNLENPNFEPSSKSVIHLITYFLDYCI